MTSLYDRLRHQSFHFMRFAGHGDRINDSKAWHKSRNERQVGFVNNYCDDVRGSNKFLSRFDTFSTTLWHISSQTHQEFMYETRRRTLVVVSLWVRVCFCRFGNCDIGKLIPSDMRQAQSTCFERCWHSLRRWETETRQLNLPLNSEHNEHCTKSVIAHDTKNGKWNYGDFLYFLFRWFLFFAVVDVVRLLLFRF